MNIEEFDYNLPENLIAQTPLPQRDASKLMILNRQDQTIEHKTFKNIIDYLEPEDVLVLNDTKVIPARLIGYKEETKAHIEILLLKDLGNDTWECLARPAKRLKEGTTIIFAEGLLKGKVTQKFTEGLVHVKLEYKGILLEILDQLGQMPLPPYIHKQLKDKDRYQTIYAKNIGSAAAPTAGLHFTEELLEQIKSKGIKVVFITLHVGLGTFRPVQVTNILEHKMHSEYYIITQEVAEVLNNARQEGHKIYAVGTTSTRVLETVAGKYNKFIADSGNTDIFIYPGYKFKGIDGLITNFHLPKSTLLMLVSALATREFILRAYQEAIDNNYRFFSFGDAMFIK